MMQIGRLASRREGNDWNAYYAMPGTMAGALKLGTIVFKLVSDFPDRKNQFMDLMRECVADIIEAETGMRPSWHAPGPAPDHERAGHG